jgi:hypothetical protein
MATNKLFQAHEADRTKAERATADYNKELSDLGDKTATRNNATPAMEDKHHGRKAASENRRK